MSNKSNLPLIVGYGGFNAAGRSSFHHAYKRMVIESLGSEERNNTLLSLATLMGIVTCRDGHFEDQEGQVLTAADIASRYGPNILASTLVRRIEKSLIDLDATSALSPIELHFKEGADCEGTVARRQLSKHLPEGWRILSRDNSGNSIEVQTPNPLKASVEFYKPLAVQAAGQLPSGFDPGLHYPSRFHPRGLQLAVTAASDAIHSMGIPWRDITQRVRPDQIGVYAGSVMSQLDETGFGGVMQARLRGKRVSSKQVALGMGTMPADFINAYVLGSVGTTAGISGACATFLYNLRQGVEEIRSGARRVVLVGSSEAPILTEIIEGYAAMSALATDANLMTLDGTSTADYRRASRPFGENCGFTLGESGQYAVLMDDELALELGANIYAAVPGVYVNADGFKKSISAPGPGNYITVAKAVGLARTLLGDDSVRHRSFIQAHGSSTPHNRVTESKIFDSVARAFAIESWPIAAVKSYLGHSLGSASGDQLMASLGVFNYGIIPGIKTMGKVADDVYADRLAISSTDREVGSENLEVSFLNSKGFGGNNATATILSPTVAETLLQKRYGKSTWSTYLNQREEILARAADYDAQASTGDLNAIYQFGMNMVDEDDIELSADGIRLPGQTNDILLGDDEGFGDLIDE